MNMIIGFLESYLLGLAPSKMPPCLGAREAAAGAAAATLAVTVVVAIPYGYVRGLPSNKWRRYVPDAESLCSDVGDGELLDPLSPYLQDKVIRRRRVGCDCKCLGLQSPTSASVVPLFVPSSTIPRNLTTCSSSFVDQFFKYGEGRDTLAVCLKQYVLLLNFASG